MMTTITQEPEVRFIHLRYFDDNIQLEPNGGLTIAYVVSRVNNIVDPVDDKFTVVYALAKCHEKDAFVKAVGRAKAAGRLKSSKLLTKYGGFVHLPVRSSRTEVLNAVLADVREKFPLEENLV